MFPYFKLKFNINEYIVVQNSTIFSIFVLINMRKCSFECSMQIYTQYNMF